MESIKLHYMREYADDHHVTSIAAVINPTPFSPITEGFDLLILIVGKNTNQQEPIHHYIKDHIRIQERRITPQSLRHGVETGANRLLTLWLLRGEIWMDKELFLEDLRHRVLEFPSLSREKKMLAEFACFLKNYMQSKHYIKEGQCLDAYSHIVAALQHWARIAVIEAGFHPEITVWSQVRKLNPGIYKLYEELTSSRETTAQRIELVLLASEFSVMAKMETCCAALIKTINSREEPWSVQELEQHLNLTSFQLDLGLLLNKMVEKSLIREVVVTKDRELDILELRYNRKV